MYNPDYHGILNQGWICSRCNRSFAPFISECPYCNSARTGFAITTNPATVNDNNWWEEYEKQSQTGKPSNDNSSKTISWNGTETNNVKIGKDGSIMWTGPVPEIMLNSILD